MDPDSAERFQRADAVFDAALDLPRDEREMYVDKACGSDDDLRTAVRRLLQAHERSTGFLSLPAAGHAEPLLESLLQDGGDRLPAPRQLGPFRIVRQVGHGGMGAVYLGERVDGQFEQRVAIKLIRGELAADSLVRRFLQERRILASLEHPHIARLIDGGVTPDGMPWFAMEFVEGQAIQQHCAELRLSLDDRLRLFRDVCRAVEYAHQTRVIHRDLKPGNVLVTDGGTVKLLDFGIARLLDPDSSTAEASAALTARPLLTPEYAAPEQLRGEPATVVSDVYALGVILYELLVGERPYQLQGRSAASIERIICETDPPRPSVTLRRRHGQWRRLRGDLDTIVLKAMNKEPDRRYASVTALLDDLLRFSEGGPLLARPDTIPYRMRRYVGRNRAAAVATTGFTAFALSIAGLYAAHGDSLTARLPASILAAGTLNQSDALLVADFDIRGGADSSLGSVIAEAVRADLGQSNVVTIVPAPTIRAALERMQQPAGTPLVSAVARELALREGIKAVVEGEIVPFRDNFVVTIRLISAEGDELASLHETTDPPNLIRTVGRLTRRLRGRIGESLESVSATPPLEQVTTPSLTALRKYAAGAQALRYENDHLRAVTLLKEAVALDSTFAMAWIVLSAAYLNAVYPPELANEAAERAYRYRDRLPDRERYHVMGLYFRAGPGRDRVRAAEAYEAGVRLDSGGFANNLGLLYQSRREYARAESLFRWYVARGSDLQVAYENLSNTLFFQGKREEAEAVEAETSRRFPDAERWGRAAWYLYDRGQLDSAQRALERQYAEGDATQRLYSSLSLSALHLTRGQLAEAERARRVAMEANLARGVRPDSMVEELWAASVDIWQRDRPERGIRRLAEALARYPLASLPLRNRAPVRDETYYLWVARSYAQARRPERARAVLAQFNADLRDTALKRGSAPQVHSVLGEIALAEGRPLVALEEFQRAERRPDGPLHLVALWRHADIGRAFDQAGMTDSAIASFERYLETPQLNRFHEDGAYSARILQRLGSLYEAKGDRAKAIEYYARFVERWRNADPELQPRVAAVRRRLESLRGSQGH